MNCQKRFRHERATIKQQQQQQGKDPFVYVRVDVVTVHSRVYSQPAPRLDCFPFEVLFVFDST